MHPQRNIIESAEFIVENKLQNELITAFANDYGIQRNHDNFKKIKQVHVSLDNLADELLSHFESQIHNKHISRHPEMGRDDPHANVDSYRASTAGVRGAGHLATLTDNLKDYHAQLTGDRPDRIRFLKKIGIK